MSTLVAPRVPGSLAASPCRMHLDQIMSKPVYSIPPKAGLDAARAMMLEHRVHHLVVTDGDHVIGLITNHDVQRRRLPLYDDKWLVEDVMSEPVITGSPKMTTREAAKLMRGTSVGCLPVVEGKQLVGIITTADLLDVLAK